MLQAYNRIPEMTQIAYNKLIPITVYIKKPSFDLYMQKCVCNVPDAIFLRDFLHRFKYETIRFTNTKPCAIHYSSQPTNRCFVFVRKKLSDDQH